MMSEAQNVADFLIHSSNVLLFKAVTGLIKVFLLLVDIRHLQ